MTRQIAPSKNIIARATAAVAGNVALLALPREDRMNVRPLAALLPEIQEANRFLRETRPELSLHIATMADGSGFAEVRNERTYGVVLSSERFPDNQDQVQRWAATAAVAEAVLDGALA